MGWLTAPRYGASILLPYNSYASSKAHSDEG